MFKVQKRNLVTFIFLLFSGFASGQANINSPYSRFGVGDLQPEYFGLSRSLAGASTPIREFNSVNYFNPASYSALRITTLEAGLRFNITQLKGSGDQQTNYNGQNAYLALGFPLTRKWGLSFGLIPYSNIGYSQSQRSISESLGEQTILFSGQGGLTQFYLGTGYQVAKGLSLGVNAGYLFGNIDRSEALEFTASQLSGESLFNTRNTSKSENGGFKFGYGVQYELNLNKDSKLLFAYSGAYKVTLTTRKSQFTERYSVNSQRNEVRLDITDSIDGGKSSTILPTTHNAGVSYRFRDRVLVVGDAKYSRWSKFSTGDRDAKYTSSFVTAIAFQFTPDITSVSSYLALIDYRLGFNLDNSYLLINGQRIKQYSGTLGFGLPIRGSGGYNPNQIGAKVNLAFEAGRRGTLNSNLVQENYLRVSLGFVLNQLWFYRKRYQ